MLPGSHGTTQVLVTSHARHLDVIALGTGLANFTSHLCLSLSPLHHLYLLKGWRKDTDMRASTEHPRSLSLSVCVCVCEESRQQLWTEALALVYQVECQCVMLMWLAKAMEDFSFCLSFVPPLKKTLKSMGLFRIIFKD